MTLATPASGTSAVIAPRPTLTSGMTATANPNKALWEKGDFTRLAACMRESGQELVDWIGIGPHMDVLDLGCGDGTTALPAARCGARVLGVDIASNLVAAGRARADAAGLINLRFEEGDASDLHRLEDDSFDLVISIFGAMFAPRPLETASEMVRVTRSGGRIVMGNWIAGDPTLVAQVLKISSAYTAPPPEGFVSPLLWGQENVVRDRFAAAGIPQDRIVCERATYTFRYAGSPSMLLAIFRDYYGPTMNAFEAARRSHRQEALKRELEDLFTSENRADTGGTEIPATYLRVTVQV